MKSKTSFVYLVSLFLVGFSASVFAAPKVNLELIAEKEVIEINKKGKEVKKRIQTNETVPGDVLFYTITYENVGDETATQAAINNSIPKGTLYQDKSAWGDNSDIIFSIDSGGTYKKPGSLTYELEGPDGKKQTRTASSEQYTDIRWVIEEIAPNTKGRVGYSVVVQ